MSEMPLEVYEALENGGIPKEVLHRMFPGISLDFLTNAGEMWTWYDIASRTEYIGLTENGWDCLCILRSDRCLARAHSIMSSKRSLDPRDLDAIAPLMKEAMKELNRPMPPKIRERLVRGCLCRASLLLPGAPVYHAYEHSEDEQAEAVDQDADQHAKELHRRRVPMPSVYTGFADDAAGSSMPRPRSLGP